MRVPGGRRANPDRKGTRATSVRPVCGAKRGSRAQAGPRETKASRVNPGFREPGDPRAMPANLDLRALRDPEGDVVFFQELAARLPRSIELVERDTHAEDPTFVKEAVTRLIALIEST